MNGDTDRRLANVLRYGTVVSLSGRRVVVKLDDDTTTPPLQWFAARAGKNRDWNPPEAGEQVMILSPSGELSRGTVLPAIFQDAFAENGDDGDTTRRTYDDGTVVEYNRASHQLLVDASASNGTVVVKCKTADVQASESVTLDTPETYCTGNLTVTKALNVNGTGAGGAAATINGDIEFVGSSLTHNGKNIGSTHTHGGVDPGGGSTSAPN